MEESVTDRLHNLKAVLTKIMGPQSIVCSKYTDAIEEAIDTLENEKITVSTAIFSMSAETTVTGGIIVDLYTTEDEHLQTIEFDPEDIIDEEIYGES